MKGNIYCDQKCHICGASLKIAKKRGALECLEHSDVTWGGKCRVRFGKNHIKRFKSVKEAERHLNKIRGQSDDGVYDERDWQKAAPLSFLFLRKKFAISKEKKSTVKLKQIRHIKHVLSVAGKEWDQRNVKAIRESDIEDFLDGDHRVGNKTLANWKSVLTDFWKWVVRREKKHSHIEMPEFPDIEFELEMKKIVTIQDQQDIIKEIKNITWDKNPRIWLGIRLMSWYPKVRPGEMLRVKEGDINYKNGWIVFPKPKEKKKPKYILLLPEHLEILKSVRNMDPQSLPDMFFFRHLKTKSGVKAGVQFGPKYFNLWWKKACKNLGIEGVALYAGIKHSTVTALGQIMSPEQIQHDITGHVSDAFKRYFLPDTKRAAVASRKLVDMQEETQAKIIDIKKKVK